MSCEGDVLVMGGGRERPLIMSGHPDGTWEMTTTL